ncbi:MAG: hypothetical protein SFZ02_11450 [bacterium]|nr:hypothetical protein [bacterium]
MMSFVTTPIYEEIYQFLVSAPTPQAILDFHASEYVQMRVRELLDKNRDGQLTPDERAELDQFEQVNHLVSMMKIYARKSLKV